MSGKSVDIVVIEDKVAESLDLQSVLSDLGYTSVCSTTGVEGIMLVASMKPRLALVDYMLEEKSMKGTEAASIIEGLLDVPVIFVTGRPKDVLKSYHGGHRIFRSIRKPYKPEALKELIEQTLRWEQEIKDRLRSVGSDRTDVFVSYAHEDASYLEEFLGHASYLLDKVSVFTDKDINPGEKWKETIERALEESRIAVVFASRSFNSSAFIKDVELPLILRRAEQGGLQVFVVCLEPMDFAHSPLNAFQALNDPQYPVSSMRRKSNRREWFWVKLVERIWKGLAY